MTKLKDIVESTLSDIETRVGVSFASGKAEIAALMESEADDLRAISHEPGFEGAVVRSRDIIAARMGLNLVDVTTAARSESYGLLFSALRVAAILLA